MTEEQTPAVVAETPAVEGATASPEAPAVAGTAAPEAPAEAIEQVRPLGEQAKPDKGGFVWGTGRRKSSVARVRIKPGDGKFLVNKRDVNEYFSELQHKAACHKPLEVTDTLGKLDIHVNCHGGGITGQAEAILLGVARALKGYDPTLEATLRSNNLLTRDPRQVERQKPGQPGARKRFQFSKR